MNAVFADADHIVALWNGGNLRADIVEGTFGEEALAQVLPYPNKVAVVYMTGAELVEALEAASQALPYTEETAKAASSFMQVSGMSYTVNVTVPYAAGEAYGDNWFRATQLGRVDILDVCGYAFDKDATYAVITNNANFNGMDSSYIFKEAAARNEQSTITVAGVREVVFMYISEVLNGQITVDYENAAGRITIMAE